MPSANRLAEQTIRTLSEMLRMLTDRENGGIFCLGRVVAMNNGSVHKSTVRLQVNT